jgi:hypothetical protein
MKTSPNRSLTLTVGDDQVTYPGTDCNNAYSNVYYVGVHAITKNRYDAMIKLLFGSVKEAVPRAVNLPTDCSIGYIEWNDNNTVLTNDDLTIQYIPSKSKKGKYSINFFKGLQHLFSPTTYEFSKAIGEDGLTVVIRVKKNGTPVYYGDLTHMFP